MSINLHNRSFLSLRDFTPEEIAHLLKLAAELKAAKLAETEVKHLVDKELALIIEKDSARTHAGFEAAAHDQGAHVTYLGPQGSHIGKKETVKDTARVLGRLYDGIEYRGVGQDIVEELSKWAGVPVYNGLTKEFHPTQVLADLLTMTEHNTHPLNKISFCFLGDIGRNVGNSLMFGGVKMGMDVRLCGPKALWPNATLVADARKIAAKTGALLTVTEDTTTGVRDADFLYTDVWLSMDDPEKVWADRIKLLLPFQVNAALMKQTKLSDTKFMHCLPAFHNTQTEVGARAAKDHGLTALEVTDEVFESPASIVFDQAENRMHTIKAVLVATLGDGAAGGRGHGRKRRATPA